MKTQIQILENKISTETNKFKVKSLKEKLGWLKAEDKGNFITKEDLVEYKQLLIWTSRHNSMFKTPEVLNRVMTLLLNKIETGKVVFRTRVGIKGILTRLTEGIALDVTFEKIVEIEGSELLSNFNLRQQSRLHQRYEDFKMGTINNF